MAMLPVRKYIEEGGDSTKPYKVENVPPVNITLVFECEDCKTITKDDVSNITYNGAPMCCNEEMLLSHANVTI